jgi:hypothetical protein
VTLRVARDLPKSSSRRHRISIEVRPFSWPEDRLSPTTYFWIDTADVVDYTASSNQLRSELSARVFGIPAKRGVEYLANGLEMRNANRPACSGVGRGLLCVAILVLILSGTFPVSCTRSKHDQEKLADLTECYQIADQHWFEDNYNQWLIDDVYVNVQTPNPNVTPANVCDTFAYWSTEDNQWVRFSHHLQEGHTQQYYEMIGEYDQFSWGWDDYDGGTGTSQHRESYLACLHEAGALEKSLPTMPE